jgi:hypothetical protein
VPYSGSIPGVSKRDFFTKRMPDLRQEVSLT